MIILLLGLFIFNYWIYKTLLAPAVFQSILWLVYFALLQLNIDVYYVRVEKVDFLILLQSIGFSLGSIICFLCSKKSSINEFVPINTSIKDLVYGNVILSYPFFLSILFVAFILFVKTSGSLSIANLADIRQNLADDDGKNYGIFGLIQFMLSIYLLLYYITKKQFKKRMAFFSILFFYFTSLLGAKAAFLFFFSALLYSLIWLNRISKAKVVYSLLVIVLIFLGITLLRTGSSDTSFLIDVLLIYSITSLPGLAMVSHGTNHFFGYQTFRVFYIWLNKIGFSFPISPVLLQYTYTPLPTNVYSYIKPYYSDFGISGVFWLPLILGFGTCYIYIRAKKGFFGSFILNALLFFPLIMQFFDDQYFRWVSNWIYFSLFILLFTKLDFHVNRRSNSYLQPEH